jgi:hypothetical protein
VKEFQEVLKGKGTPSANHIYKGMGHNFDVERWEDAAGRAAGFFDKYMKDAKPKKSQRARARKGADRDAAVGKDGGVEGTDRSGDSRKNDAAARRDRGGDGRKHQGADDSERGASPRKDRGPDQSPG